MHSRQKTYPAEWGLAGDTLPWINRLYRKIKNIVLSYKAKGVHRKILLVAHNRMMLRKLAEIVAIIEDTPNIQWFCTIVAPPSESQDLIQDINSFAYTFVHPYHASIQLWDLIIVADHHATHNFNNTIPSLQVGHGMGDSKLILNSKERYHYARRNVLTKKGKSVCTCYLEASERRKKEAIDDIPILKDHIAVVGSIEADRILSMEKHRSELRNEYGYSDDDIVLFICSTHGSNSLMDSMGHELIAEALALPSNYKFILSSHFLTWQNAKNNEKSLGESLLQYECKRVKVLRPEDDFLTPLVVADILLSDFTSASLLFVILNRPVVFIPFPNGAVSEKSPLWRLYCEVTRIKKIEDVHPVITNLEATYPKEVLESYSAEIVSYPGEASERIKHEIYRLIEL